MAIGRARQGRGIRRHLFQVLLVSIVPIGLFAAALLYLHWETQERERARSQIQSVRLLAAVVDNALDSTTERLAILARLWGSRALTDQEIYAEAKETLRANADWRNILAFRADGSAVFGDDQPLGTPLPPNPMFDVWRPVVEGRTPVVSDVLVTPPQATPAIFVGVPVVRGGAVSHVLVASLNLTWYDRLLARQGLVEGGVSGLFDRNFRFVARSVEGDERRGTRPTEELIADMKQQREGVGRYTNLNRTSVYTTWTFTRHGWGVGLATPTALIDNPAAGPPDPLRRALGSGRGRGPFLRLLEGAPDHGVPGVARRSGPARRRWPSHRRFAPLERAGDRPRAGGARARQRAAADHHAAA
jgi:hypothetical protein